MEETLTTENTDSQVDNNIEPSNTTEEQVAEESTTTDLSYDDAWDKVDLDDANTFEPMLNDAPEETVEATEEPSTEEVEATEAFMSAAPVLNFKGKDIPIDNQEELLKLAQKGFSFEAEMTKIKPQKKVLNTVDGIPLEVLQAVSDLNQGKQEALEYLKDHYGVKDTTSDDMWNDNEEAPAESTYTPEVTVDNPVKDYWDDYAQGNTEAAAKVSDVYKDLDQSFQSELYKPEVFPLFVNSVESGEFNDVYPLAVKERVLNPALSWVDAYATAAQKVNKPEAKRNDPPASAQIPSTQEERNVSPTGAADRIWDDNDYFEEKNREIFS